MLFPDVVGQENLLQHLQDMVAQNRLSHAILLVGKPGTGVLPIAVNFAQHVVSLHSSPSKAEVAQAGIDLFGNPVEPEPGAGEPAAVKLDPLARSLTHPDLHLSFPTVKSDRSEDPPISAEYMGKFREFYLSNPYGTPFEWLQFLEAENKQGNITARECLEIVKKLSLKPYRSRWKVLMMWQPEYLGTEGNRLLKIIEEPPADTLFVLATENENEILGTLLSRCQIIRIPPLQPAAIEKALVERNQIPENQAKQIAMLSEGSYANALRLSRHNDENMGELLRDWMNACTARGSTATKRFSMQVGFIDGVSKLGREKQKHLLQYFIHILEQCLRLQVIGEDRLLLPPAEKEFAMKVNKIIGVSQQQALATELEHAIYYIERNANPKMLFMALSLKFRSIIYERVNTGII